MLTFLTDDGIGNEFDTYTYVNVSLIHKNKSINNY